MLTTSITHTFQSALQYSALVLALFLYLCAKDGYQHFRHTRTVRTSHSRRSTSKGHDRQTSSTDKRLLKLYQWIRKRRQRYNLTQQEFAEIMNVDPRTVGRWERGEVKPQPHHYLKFLRLKDTIYSFYSQELHIEVALLYLVDAQRAPFRSRTTGFLGADAHFGDFDRGYPFSLGIGKDGGATLYVNSSLTLQT